MATRQAGSRSHEASASGGRCGWHRDLEVLENGIDLGVEVLHPRTQRLLCLDLGNIAAPFLPKQAQEAQRSCLSWSLRKVTGGSQVTAQQCCTHVSQPAHKQPCGVQGCALESVRGWGTLRACSSATSSLTRASLQPQPGEIFPPISGPTRSLPGRRRFTSANPQSTVLPPLVPRAHVFQF